MLNRSIAHRSYPRTDGCHGCLQSHPPLSMPIAPRHDGIPQPATATMLRNNSSHVTQEFVRDTTAQPPLKPLLLKFDLLDQTISASSAEVQLSRATSASRHSLCRTCGYSLWSSCAPRVILLAYYRVYIRRGGVFYIYFRPSSLRA